MLDRYPVSSQMQATNPNRPRVLWALVIILGILLGVSATAISFTQMNKQDVIIRLPEKIVTKADFTVYQFEGEPPLKYRVDPETIRLDNGVLLYQLIKPGAPSVTITEQSIGSYTDLTRTYGEKFATNYGQAIVQENLSRTTGEVFTTDKTWIIANSSAPIGMDTMKDLLKALTKTTT